MTPVTFTRRRLLIGGGALAASAAGLTAFEKWQQILDRAYRLDTAIEGDHTPPRERGQVIDATFASRVLGAEVGYSIALPPGSASGDPLPVCFCLPGRGGTAASVTGDTMHMADFLGQAVKGGGARFALAAVDGGESYWHRRTSGEDRMAMLTEEFVPLCARRFKLGGTHGRTAVMGWSMGGYGALLAAETHPELFVACAAASPALWTSFAAMASGAGDAFDNQADYEAHDVFRGAGRLSDTTVLLQCGSGDPFYSACQDFAKLLPKGAEVDFAWGNHTPAYWHSVAPRQIRFLGAALTK